MIRLPHSIMRFNTLNIDCVQENSVAAAIEKKFL